jgi:hypothetical protein
LPQGIYMWNMKAISPTNQKLLPRLMFSKSRSNSKVKVMVSNERSYFKEQTHEMRKLYHQPIKSYNQS